LTEPASDWCPHKLTRANDFKSLPALARNFEAEHLPFAKGRSNDLILTGERRFVSFRTPMRSKTGESERNISLSETKRFATLIVSG
jgi:hypothetical protein